MKDEQEKPTDQLNSKFWYLYDNELYWSLKKQLWRQLRNSFWQHFYDQLWYKLESEQGCEK